MSGAARIPLAFFLNLALLCQATHAQYGYAGYPYGAGYGGLGNFGRLFGNLLFGSPNTGFYPGYPSYYPNYPSNAYPCFSLFGCGSYPNYGNYPYNNNNVNGGWNTAYASSSGFGSASASAGNGFFG